MKAITTCKNKITSEIAMSRAAISVRELAEILGISEISVYRGIKSEKIPAVKVGGRQLIPRNYFEKFIKGGE